MKSLKAIEKNYSLREVGGDITSLESTDSSKTRILSFRHHACEMNDENEHAISVLNQRGNEDNEEIVCFTLLKEKENMKIISELDFTLDRTLSLFMSD